MKIKCFVVFCTLLFVQYVFAVELWNGFTDDMTQEQVIARVRNVLSVDCDWQDIEDQNLFSSTSRKKIEIFYGDQEYRNDKFMLPDSILCVFCNDPALDDENSNIVFYFFNNKLYAIYIKWNKLISNEVVQKSKENYGKSYKEITDYRPEDEVFFVRVPASWTEWLQWDFEEKELYLSIPDDTCSNILDYIWESNKKAKLYAISKNHYAEYKMELERRNAIQKQQADEERQKKVESIKF